MSSDLPIDIALWVESASDQMKKEQREAIHVTIEAISLSEELHDKMIMKGGTLMSIAYDSPRFSQDIDYSTPDMHERELVDSLIHDLANHLDIASVHLSEYNLLCRLQSWEVKPKDANASFPTLKINIGYAKRSNARKLKRLLAGNSSDIIKIDYSFNEEIITVKTIDIGGKSPIFSYSLHDLIAEKFRAVLQQEVRKRNRRQDIFDLYFLLTTKPLFEDDKIKILDSLVKKSKSRGISAHIHSLNSEDIRERAKYNYKDLVLEVSAGELDFDLHYQVVSDFYASLPWPEDTTRLKM